MYYEDVFRRERLRRVIQDVLVDGACYDKPRWGAGGYRFRRRFDVEQEWNGIIILAKASKEERNRG